MTSINEEPCVNDKTIIHNASIYRYKFSNDIMHIITEFAKVHQYDDRKTYKEYWIKWLDDNHDMISNEITRLTRLGYEGDIEDKMFKAGRYYFRKKNIKKNLNVISSGNRNDKKNGNDNDNDNENDNENKNERVRVNECEKQQRRNYINMGSDVLDAMDNHIISSIKKPGFSPASGYTNFCTINVELLQTEIIRLCNESTIDSSELTDKIKKTYKNRYFIITRK
jgi:hypothetical protein